MRGLLFLLTLVLAACGGNGDGFKATPEPLQHVPAISNLKLTPDSALYMEGDGSIVVTAEFAFTDLGQDIQTLQVKMSDGTSLEIPLAESVDTVSGTLAETFDVTTADDDGCTIEIWLVDKAGQSSNHLIAFFQVKDGEPPNWAVWLQREIGLPFVLNAVHWSGSQFIAVGDGGAVLTSPDGLDWTLRDSGTDVNLHAIGFDLFDHVAVGDSATVLGSADSGVTWHEQVTGSQNVSLRAVDHHAWPEIAGGKLLADDSAYIMRSPDHGQTWEVIDALPQSGRWITGMARGAGLVVATTQISQLPNDARILVSGGGLEWIEVVIDTEQISTLCILWDGNRFWAGGTEGRIYRSFDGMNWTILRTPVNTSFQALAWSGSRLIAQGTLGPAVTTPDGGETWKTYDLGFDHESRGLAFGAGRYVSVGSAPGGGAIFSTP